MIWYCSSVISCSCAEFDNMYCFCHQYDKFKKIIYNDYPPLRTPGSIALYSLPGPSPLSSFHRNFRSFRSDRSSNPSDLQRGRVGNRPDSSWNLRLLPAGLCSSWLDSGPPSLACLETSTTFLGARIVQRGPLRPLPRTPIKTTPALLAPPSGITSKCRSHTEQSLIVALDGVYTKLWVQFHCHAKEMSFFIFFPQLFSLQIHSDRLQLSLFLILVTSWADEKSTGAALLCDRECRNPVRKTSQRKAERATVVRHRVS